MEQQIEELLSLPEGMARCQYLKTSPELWTDEVVNILKARADQLLRVDVDQSLGIASLICDLSDLSGQLCHRAVGLLAEANGRSIGLGEYQQARRLYDEAVAVYRRLDSPVDAARAQVGKVWPLACLGLYEEAVTTSDRAASVLEEAQEWSALATLTMNMAAVHGRQGEDAAALDMLERARQIHRRQGAENTPVLAFIEQNRAIVLRNLGRFDESIAASQDAWKSLTSLGQTVEAARARQNLAITYFGLGRYNEALGLLNEARDVFWQDGRRRDAILVDLFVSDCLLMLRRLTEVLDRTRQVRELFGDLGSSFEVGQSILNEAVAYAGLARYDKAGDSLTEARRRFEIEGNEVWMAVADLEHATILLHQGRRSECNDALCFCAEVFRKHNLPVREAQTNLVAARVAAANGERKRASEMVHRALALSEDMGLTPLTYEGYYLLGLLAEEEGNALDALEAYERAISDLEKLRGRLMVEFRIAFLEDKQKVYEDVVGLCLDLGRPRRGLEFAERAKSRTLIDLLACRVELGVRARSANDVPLVERLRQLRARRDRLYRRGEIREEIPLRGGGAMVQPEVLELEKQITDLWHRLLIRNGDYARDAAMWQVRAEPVQPYLENDTALIEYFLVRGRVVCFTVTGEGVVARYLPSDLTRIQHLIRLFWLNLRTVPRSSRDRVTELAANACRLLQELYILLIGPLADVLEAFDRIIVVPHGALHYLPFHALHDGEGYLLERCEISYLPSSSVLRYCREAHRPTLRTGASAFGYSFRGRLPRAVEEARDVVRRLGGKVFLEEAATIAHLHEASSSCRVLHLATHGEYRPDNPLFSGLALADGWLTTLDIFGLRLVASLVTLSACQTGRNVVGGGDELIGLMRAFLYAGAASLVLTLWPVEDRSAAEIAGTFYDRLAEDWTKGAALRSAQRQALSRPHPYYWAPFYLVGDTGPL